MDKQFICVYVLCLNIVIVIFVIVIDKLSLLETDWILVVISLCLEHKVLGVFDLSILQQAAPIMEKSYKFTSEHTNF